MADAVLKRNSEHAAPLDTHCDPGYRTARTRQARDQERPTRPRPARPGRESDDIYPSDEYLVRYQVAGVKTDKDGKADLEVTVRLTNPAGKAVLEPKPASKKFDLSQGGDVVQTYGFITVNEKATPGEYKLTVTVRDKLSNETASFDRKLTLKPAPFQIIAPRFYLNAEGTVPAGTTLMVGQTLYYRFRVVGFDTTDRRVGLVMRGPGGCRRQGHRGQAAGAARRHHGPGQSRRTAGDVCRLGRDAPAGRLQAPHRRRGHDRQKNDHVRDADQGSGAVAVSFTHTRERSRHGEQY